MTNAERSTSQPTNPTAALWRIAVNEYQAAEAAYQAISAKHDEQSAAYTAELGERPTDLENYFAGRLPEHFAGDLKLHIATAIAAKDYRGQDISAEDYAAIMQKAVSLVEQAREYRRRSDEIFARTIGLVESDWEEALSDLCAKRDTLLESTAAPDEAAMLYKLELLAAYMVEGDESEALLVTAIRDDARRLFGGK